MLNNSGVSLGEYKIAASANEVEGEFADFVPLWAYFKTRNECSHFGTNYAPLCID